MKSLVIALFLGAQPLLAAEYACTCIGYEKGGSTSESFDYDHVSVDGPSQHRKAAKKCRRLARKHQVVFKRVSCSVN